MDFIKYFLFVLLFKLKVDFWKMGGCGNWGIVIILKYICIRIYREVLLNFLKILNCNMLNFEWK